MEKDQTNGIQSSAELIKKHKTLEEAHTSTQEFKSDALKVEGTRRLAGLLVDRYTQEINEFPPRPSHDHLEDRAEWNQKIAKLAKKKERAVQIVSSMDNAIKRFDEEVDELAKLDLIPQEVLNRVAPEPTVKLPLVPEEVAEEIPAPLLQHVPSETEQVVEGVATEEVVVEIPAIAEEAVITEEPEEPLDFSRFTLPDGKKLSPSTIKVLKAYQTLKKRGIVATRQTLGEEAFPTRSAQGVAVSQANAEIKQLEEQGITYRAYDDPEGKGKIYEITFAPQLPIEQEPTGQQAEPEAPTSSVAGEPELTDTVVFEASQETAEEETKVLIVFPESMNLSEPAKHFIQTLFNLQVLQHLDRIDNEALGKAGYYQEDTHKMLQQVRNIYGRHIKGQLDNPEGEIFIELIPDEQNKRKNYYRLHFKLPSEEVGTPEEDSSVVEFPSDLQVPKPADIQVIDTNLSPQAREKKPIPKKVYRVYITQGLRTADVDLHPDGHKLLEILETTTLRKRSDIQKELRKHDIDKPVQTIVDQVNGAIARAGAEYRIGHFGKGRETKLIFDTNTILFERPELKEEGKNNIRVESAPEPDSVLTFRKLSSTVSEIVAGWIQEYPDIIEQLGPALHTLEQVRSDAYFSSAGTNALLENPEKLTELINSLPEDFRQNNPEAVKALELAQSWYPSFKVEPVTDTKNGEDSASSVTIFQEQSKQNKPIENDEVPKDYDPVWGELNGNQRGTIVQFARLNAIDNNLGKTIRILIEKTKNNPLLQEFQNWDDTEGVPIGAFRQAAKKALGMRTSIGRSSGGTGK